MWSRRSNIDDELRGRVEALPGLGASAWLEFDAEIRSTRFPATWSTALRSRLTDGTATPADVLLAACHRDGHLREAALRISTDPRIAALRSGDWVPQVRDLARERCAAALPDALPALVGLARAMRDRAHGGWLAEAVTAALTTAAPEVLAAARAVEDRKARRMVFATTAAALPLPELLHLARTDRDREVRLICGAAALRAARAADDPGAVHPLLTARTSALRADAVHTLALAGDLRPAAAALTDRTAVVRATAQAALRRAGEDPAAHYRRVDPPTPESVAGLGETGSRADADAVIPLLAAPLPRMRAAAVDAVHALGAGTPDLLATLLTDPSPRVSRRAVRALRATPPPEPFLWAALAPGNPTHQRTAAYALLRAASPACRLHTDLLLLADPADPLHGAAERDIAEWLRSGSATAYLRPGDAPWADLLAGAAPTLGQERVRVLRFHLGLRH
ncbi:hypothetical protein [Actinokineospora spheciospongiae]|uniref:hypothetical protein n=1 Tax=Actinokineospora spheciospongiae TaxID=909613 RepID=UPI000D710E00|nr:hypothetical protein [Actinokineospora spheciospongiae]PWW59558.1 hypothetical protein DFQ13_108195 [Actinokineospora spheciospongiae]